MEAAVLRPGLAQVQGSSNLLRISAMHDDTYCNPMITTPHWERGSVEFQREQLSNQMTHSSSSNQQWYNHNTTIII